MKSIKGDLIELALQGRFDVIIHGCNCFNTMGAGIARSIKQQFPEAYQADMATQKGDQGKLGTISAAEIVRGDMRFHVVNAYTQFSYRGAGPKVDYKAVLSSFELVLQKFPDARIGYPKVGAGLAGGDWQKISDIIDDVFAKVDHTLVVFEPT